MNSSSIFHLHVLRLDLQSALMFDSLLTFAQGVTKMDFKTVFHEQSNVSCKNEQVGQDMFLSLL